MSSTMHALACSVQYITPIAKYLLAISKHDFIIVSLFYQVFLGIQIVILAQKY